jgi:hypothetical protein
MKGRGEALTGICSFFVLLRIQCIKHDVCKICMPGKADFIQSHISTDVLLEKKPFFGMRKLLPTEITAQVIPVLPLEQFPVDPEQRSQQPAAHRQLINIILLKKMQIHASYGYHRQPVSSHGSRNGSHP